eukprot:TRINITY_DN3076_c0_g1_i1.p1 TRINITY_DN3076_c0_g1~~TRINITY_DN3076_c0_g1_i1.p1  ORF type:complete len:547 (+),score=157.09 TRINITY_DN3076_c0_g1_i1:158-1642(+)
MEAKLNKLKVPELKKELIKLGLPTNGLKADLVARLAKAQLKSSKSDEPEKRKKEESEDEDESEVEEVSAPQMKRQKSTTKKSSSQEISAPISFNKLREGPIDVRMVCVDPQNSQRNLSFHQNDLEVRQNTYDYHSNCDFIKANVSVRGGKWYFEVALQNTNYVSVGWCTSDFSHAKGTGQFWSWDCQRQQKMSSGDSSKYGEHVGHGDVIGCGLDIEMKSMSFWNNGKEQGVAYSNVVPNETGYLVPYVVLTRRAQVICDFGKNLVFPQEGYNKLNSYLVDKDIQKLANVYSKYRDIGKEANEEETLSASQALEQECIGMEGIMQYISDLKFQDEDDPAIFLICWKLNCKRLYKISKDEFMNGWAIQKCKSLDDMKAAVNRWKDEVSRNDALYKRFYIYMFDYLREDKQVVGIEEAMVAWNIVLKEKKWGMQEQWIKFLTEDKRKGISRDIWQQLWHFMQTYPENLKDYDPTSSWPLVYDSFVEWMKKEEEKKE